MLVCTLFWLIWLGDWRNIVGQHLFGGIFAHMYIKVLMVSLSQDMRFTTILKAIQSVVTRGKV